MNAIVPSYIDTNNTAALLADADKSEAILGGIPAGRWGQPSDMATAPYFCSRAHRTTSMALPLPSMAAGWRDEFHSWQAPKCVQLQTLEREHMSTSANGHSTASATSPLACMLRMLDRVNLVARYGVGAVDLVVFSSAPLENTVPETAILSLPYLFDNLDEADKVLQGDAGRHFLNYMEPCGLVGLTFLSAIERMSTPPRSRSGASPTSAICEAARHAKPELCGNL